MTRSSAALLMLLLPASQVAAEQSYSFAYVRFAEGRVLLQRASEIEPEEVGVNYPVLSSDRLWTGSQGRVEIEFADRSFLRLDGATKVDFLSFSEAGGKENLLRQWSGSTLMRWSGEKGERFRIDTPAGSVFPVSQGLLRIDVYEGRETVTLSTYEGVAEIASEGGSVLVRSGQRSVARGAQRPEAPFDFNTAHADDFIRWSDERDRRLARSRPIEGLPAEVGAYASEMDDYGYWQHDATYGNVWYPVVGAGWAPYTYGRWWYTPSFGYTWCSYEPWGWAPYHYGRWGFNNYGWFWIPGRHWGPAWVSWAVGPSWVGWCPLGYYNRPVVVFDSVFHRGGRAVPRGAIGNGWSFARAADLSSPAIERGRIRAEDVRLSAGEARLFESGAVLDRQLRPRGEAGGALTRGPLERGPDGDLRRGPSAIMRGAEPGDTPSGAGRVSSPSALPASESPAARSRLRDQRSDGAAREPRAIRPGEIRREGVAESGSGDVSRPTRSRSEETRGGVLRRLFPERREPSSGPAAEPAEGAPSRGTAGTREGARERGNEGSSPGRRTHSYPLGRGRESVGQDAGGEVGASRTPPRESGSSERSSGARQGDRPSPTSSGRGDGGARYRSTDRGSSRAPSSGGSGSSASRGGSGGGSSSRPSGGGASSTRRSRQRD